jgi:hypothetical protein
LPKRIKISPGEVGAVNIAWGRQRRSGRRRRSRDARDADVNAADSDHLGAVEALIGGLAGWGKPLLHTSGSSIVSGTANGEFASDRIF